MAGQEVGAGTTATLSCRITGVTNALTVTWTTSDGNNIATGGGYTVTPGKYNYFSFSALFGYCLNGSINRTLVAIALK